MDEVKVFKALRDPTRIKILELIKDKDKCICEIIPKTGKSQPNVSQHLRILKNVNLINRCKEGTNIKISIIIISIANKQIYDIIEKIRGIY